MAPPTAEEILGLAPPGGGMTPTAFVPSLTAGGGGFTPATTAGGGFASVIPRGAASDPHHDAGVIGSIGHVFSQGAADLKDVALGLPAGLYATARASAKLLTGDPKEAERLAKAMVLATITDIRHPLRHPGYTLLDILPLISGGAGGAVRLTAAARAARLGEDATRAFLTNPAKSARVIKGLTGAEAKGHYSRSGLGFATQRATDTLLQRAQPGSRTEVALNRRISKWQDRQQRVNEAVLNANVNKLWGAGKSLTNEESRALRFVAEKVPLDRRLAADQTRVDEARARVGNKPGTDPRTVKRLEERQQWGRDALNFIEPDANGIPVFKQTEEGQKLARVYGLMGKVVGDREAILSGLDLMDAERLRGATQKQARFAAGATYVEPNAARLGKTPRLTAAQRNVTRLQKRFDALVAKQNPGGYDKVQVAHTKATAIDYLAQLTHERDVAVKKIADAEFGPVDRREVARRNIERGKAKRLHARTSKSLVKRGFGTPTLKLGETVWQERYRLAEQKIADALYRNPTHPVMKRWAERDAEIERLTQALGPDESWLFGEQAKQVGDFGTRTEFKYRPRSAKLERVGAGLSIARDELEQAQAAAARGARDTGVVGAEDVVAPADAMFIGSPKQVNTFTRSPRVSSTSTFGHTRDASFRESHGETVRYGMDEPNVAKILVARGKGANKLKNLAQRIEMVRKGGTLSPSRKDDVFVWNDNAIVSQRKVPPEVKEFLNDPESFGKTPDELKGIRDQLRGAAMEWAHGENWELDSTHRQALEQAAQRGEGVFVQRSLLGDTGKPLPTRIQGRAASIADTTNNVQKSLLIYLKANYPLIQALSNTGMNIIQQGFAAPKNITRAGVMMRRDPELAAQMGDVMGTGALMTLAFEGTGKTALATQKLAHWMSGWVDGPARLSAFMHEAGKEGYKTDAQLRSLLTDESKAEELGTIAQRAKEAIVDYGNLGDTEKALIRRMFFVYPWLKGSTYWTAHFLRDHPVQAAVLNRLGVTGIGVGQADFPGGTPSYLEGAFRGPGGGLINPAGVNQFQTPVSIAAALAGLASGNPTAPQLSQFLTPALGTAVSLATQRNTLGIPLKGSLPARLRDLLIEPAPSVQAVRSAARLGVGDQDILNMLLGQAKGSKTFPNPNDPLFRFLLGGLYPRGYSPEALTRNAALERTGQ